MPVDGPIPAWIALLESENSGKEKAVTYDVKCHELANAFLNDFDTKGAHNGENRQLFLADKLAQDIQDAIESFIEHEHLLEKP